MATETPSAPQSTLQKSRATKVQQYVDRHLERTRRQVKATDLLASMIGLAALVLGFFLLAAIVDAWIWPLSPTGRLIALAILIFSIAGYGFSQILPLITRRINPEFAAKMIEESKPTFKNSLINYLSLRRSPKAAHRAVVDAVARRAAEDLSGVPDEATVDRSNLIRIGFILVGIAVASFAYILLSPKSPLPTVGRILAPSSKISKPAVVQIMDVNPGDTTVFFGESLDVSARIRGSHDASDVKIIFSTDDGQIVESKIAMEAESAGRYRGILKTNQSGIQQPLHYRIVARDGVSPEFKVGVRPNPTISINTIEITPPKYTKLPQRTIEGQGDIQALEGSSVKIKAEANLPIKLAYIELLRKANENPKPGNSDEFRVVQTIEMTSEGNEAEGDFWAALNTKRTRPFFTHYRVRFVSNEDDRNRNPNVYPVRITPDLAPEIVMVTPTKRDRSLAVNQTMLVEIEANDLDFEISTIDLHIDHKGTKLFDRDLRLQTIQGNQRVSARYLIAPSKLGLKPGDRIIFFATASDNRESHFTGQLDPNISRTENYNLVITDASRFTDDSQANENSQESDDPDGEKAQGQDRDGPSNDGSRDQNRDPNKDNQSQENDASDPSSEAQSEQNRESDSSDERDRGEQDSGESDDSNDKGENGGQGDGGDQGNNEAQGDSPESGDNSEENSKQQGSDSGTESQDNQDGSQGNSSSGGDASERDPEQMDEGDQGSAKSQSNSEENTGDKQGSSNETDGSSESASGGQSKGANNTGNGESDQGSSGNRERGDTGNDGSERNADGGANDPGSQDNDLMSGDQERLRENASSGEQFEKLKELLEERDQQDAENSGNNGDGSESRPAEAGQEAENENQEANSADGSESSDASEAKGEPSSNSDSPSGEKQSQPGDGQDPNSKQQNEEGGQSGSQSGAQNGEQNREQSGDQPGDKKSDGNSGGDQNAEKNGDEQSSSGDSQNADGNSGDQTPKQQQKGDNSQQSGGSTNGQDSGASSQSNNQQNSDSQEPTDGDTPPSNPESQSNSPSQAEQKSSPPGSGDPSSDQNGEASGDSPSSSGDQGQQKGGSEGEAQSDPNGTQAGNDENPDGSQAGGQQSEGSGQTSKDGQGQKGGQKPGDQKGGGSPGEQKGGSQSGNQGSSGDKGSKPGSKPPSSSGMPAGGSGGDGTSSGGSGAGSGGSGVDEADEANADFASKATDLILDKLKNQMDNPDPDLLDKMNWTEEDMRNFVKRWSKMKADAKKGDAQAKKEYRDALLSLGITPKQGKAERLKQTRDNQTGLSEDGAVIRPPGKLLERFNRIQKEMNRLNKN